MFWHSSARQGLFRGLIKVNCSLMGPRYSETKFLRRIGAFLTRYSLRALAVLDISLVFAITLTCSTKLRVQ